jgi:hypothetical protein
MEEEEAAKFSFRVMGCILITGNRQRTVRNYVVSFTQA